MAAMYTLIGTALVLVALLGFSFKGAQGELVDLRPFWDVFVSLSLVGLMGLGLLIMPLGVLGMLAELYDDSQRIDLFARLATGFIPPFVILAMVALVNAMTMLPTWWPWRVRNREGGSGGAGESTSRHALASPRDACGMRARRATPWALGHVAMST